MDLSAARKMQEDREETVFERPQTDIALFDEPGDQKTAVAAKADQDRNVAVSRDLLDTYFRQMGGGELLSREAEIALAKRIETAQQSVVESLCQIPLLMERIAQWADELQQGRRLLAGLVDVSKCGDEFLGAGAGQAMLSRADAVGGDVDGDAIGDAGAEAATLAESPNEARLRGMVVARLDALLGGVP